MAAATEKISRVGKFAQKLFLMRKTATGTRHEMHRSSRVIKERFCSVKSSSFAQSWNTEGALSTCIGNLRTFIRRKRYSPVTEEENNAMKTMLIGLAALAGVAVATPASAQPWHGHGFGWRGPNVVIGVPAPYAYDCGPVRERVVTPSGRVIYR